MPQAQGDLHFMSIRGEENSQYNSNHCWNSDITGAMIIGLKMECLPSPETLQMFSARRWALGPAGF